MNNYNFDNNEDWMELPKSENAIKQWIKNAHRFDTLNILYANMFMGDLEIHIRPIKKTTDIRLIDKREPVPPRAYGLKEVIRYTKIEDFKIIRLHPNEIDQKLIKKLQDNYNRLLNRKCLIP